MRATRPPRISGASCGCTMTCLPVSSEGRRAIACSSSPLSGPAGSTCAWATPRCASTSSWKLSAICGSSASRPFVLRSRTRFQTSGVSSPAARWRNDSFASPPLAPPEGRLGEPLVDEAAVRLPVERLVDHLLGGVDREVGELPAELRDRLVAPPLDLAARAFEQRLRLPA